MSDLCFESSLSVEEIDNNFKDIDFFLVLWTVCRKPLLIPKESPQRILLPEKDLFRLSMYLNFAYP